MKNASEFVDSKFNDKSAVFIYPQWSNLGFTYYFQPEIYKQPDNYYPLLKEKNIHPLWGRPNIVKFFEEEQHPERVIFYQNNAFNEESTLILSHLDSLYHRTDSVRFDGGIMVCVFDK